LRRLVSYERLKNPLLEIQGGETMDHVIEAIMEQIKYKVLHSKGFSFGRISDDVLGIYKGNKNLGICYNEGSNLFDLAMLTFDVSNPGIRPYKVIEIRKIHNVHCDDLVGIIAEYFKIKDTNYKNNCGSCGDTDTISCVICGKPIRKGCESFVGGIHVSGPVHTHCLLPELGEDDKCDEET
jgi:hypothetical protein